MTRSAQYWHVLRTCAMLVEASASICATGYNQDLRRESIRFPQNSIDFYRFSWILIDFHVFRGVDAKVTHEKRETGENLTFEQFQIQRRAQNMDFFRQPPRTQGVPSSSLTEHRGYPTAAIPTHGVPYSGAHRTDGVPYSGATHLSCGSRCRVPRLSCGVCLLISCGK